MARNRNHEFSEGSGLNPMDLGNYANDAEERRPIWARRSEGEDMSSWKRPAPEAERGGAAEDIPLPEAPKELPEAPAPDEPLTQERQESEPETAEAPKNPQPEETADTNIKPENVRESVVQTRAEKEPEDEPREAIRVESGALNRRNTPAAAGNPAEAAEKKDLLSMDRLIRIFYNDIDGYYGLCKWDSEIVGVIEQELAKDNPIAYYLKSLNRQLIGISEEESFLLMDQAAKLDYPPAQCSLAKMYEEGRGTEKDTTMYRQWLEKAADNGYNEAEGEYGVLLFEAWDRSIRNKAFLFLKNAIDKGTDNDKAVWCLGLCYMNGFGTAIDKRKAYPLYIRAAEKGNADAQEILCGDYFKGNESLEQSYKECARWGEEAIKQGKKSIRFETAYSLDKTGKRERAYELYLELANQGNIAAMNNLGCLERDDHRALEWFLRAAEKGSMVAQKNVARYYRFGIAVDKNEQKALDYYLKN